VKEVAWLLIFFRYKMLNPLSAWIRLNQLYLANTPTSVHLTVTRAHHKEQAHFHTVVKAMATMIVAASTRTHGVPSEIAALSTR
jgi:hypothetical protein